MKVWVMKFHVMNVQSNERLGGECSGWRMFRLWRFYVMMFEDNERSCFEGSEQKCSAYEVSAHEGLG